MQEAFHTVVIQWLTSLTAVFFIVDPFAATPAFLAMTAGYEHPRRRQMARRAALTCLIILSVFAIGGKIYFGSSVLRYRRLSSLAVYCCS